MLPGGPSGRTPTRADGQGSAAAGRRLPSRPGHCAAAEPLPPDSGRGLGPFPGVKCASPSRPSEAGSRRLSRGISLQSCVPTSLI